MDLYVERILEIYKNPKNFGEIQDAEIKKINYNPSCGDMISIFVKLEKNTLRQVDEYIVNDVKFKGHGCVISIASASLLLENIKGKQIQDIEKISSKEVLEILGIDLSKNPSRIKCAMLPLLTLKEGIKEIKGL